MIFVKVFDYLANKHDIPYFRDETYDNEHIFCSRRLLGSKIAVQSKSFIEGHVLLAFLQIIEEGNLEQSISDISFNKLEGCELEDLELYELIDLLIDLSGGGYGTSIYGPIGDLENDTLKDLSIKEFELWDLQMVRDKYLQLANDVLPV